MEEHGFVGKSCESLESLALQVKQMEHNQVVAAVGRPPQIALLDRKPESRL